MQAFVGKHIQIYHRLLLPHSVCGAWLQQQYKFAKNSYCSKKMSEYRLSVLCITPETRYEVRRSSYEVQVDER